MLRYLTAGESHGPTLTVIVDGIPRGVPLKSEDIDRELERRRRTQGRSARMRMESDRAKITAGVRFCKTMGHPIAVQIENAVFENQKSIWENRNDPKVTIPRPGHADFAGWAKYEGADIRDVIERASARETAVRVAAGSIAKQLLAEFDIRIHSKIIRIGSSVTEKDMKKEIADVIQKGDSIGGRFSVSAEGVVPGLGSFSQWDTRLDGKISQAIMSIPGIKAVAIGDGFNADEFLGSEFRDSIFVDSNEGIFRKSNRAGGIEGGITNGETVVVSAVMKPIPGVNVPGDTVDLADGKSSKGRYERSDSCVVESAAVIAESALAWQLADALIGRYGGDNLSAMLDAYERDKQGLVSRWEGR